MSSTLLFLLLLFSHKRQYSRPICLNDAGAWPVRNGIIFLTNAAKIALQLRSAPKPSATALGWSQRLDQIRELQQVCGTERGTPCRHCNERIFRHSVGPRGRHLPQFPCFVVEEHAMVPPAVAARDELILPSEQRMVRVRDSDGLTRNAGVRCSPLCSPKVTNSACVRFGLPRSNKCGHWWLSETQLNRSFSIAVSSR